MYRTKLEKLPQRTKVALENDLVTGRQTFSELADKYEMFVDDVQKVATGLGMHDLDCANGKEAQIEKEVRKRKTRVKITEALEQQIAEDLKKYQEKGYFDQFGNVGGRSVRGSR